MEALEIISLYSISHFIFISCASWLGRKLLAKKLSGAYEYSADFCHNLFSFAEEIAQYKPR